MRGKDTLWLLLATLLLGVLMVDVGFSPGGYTRISIAPAKIPGPGLLGQVGDTYTMDVNIESVDNLWAIGFEIRFAPFVSVLVISELSEGPFLGTGWEYNGVPWTFFAYSVDSFSGNAHVGMTRLPIPGQPRMGASGDGILMSFKLTVVEAGEYPIELADVLLLDSETSPMAYSTSDSHYYGSTADLIRVEVLPGRKIRVGETMAIAAKVRNNGDIPLTVRVRLDLSRVADGRQLRLFSGQRYLGGGIGEPQRHTDLYVDGYSGHYSGWGWVEEGTMPLLNATGDGNYIWAPDSSIPWGEMPAFFPIIGKFDFQDCTLGPDDVVDSVTLWAYTRYDWYDEECDIDVFARSTDDGGPTIWCGSLWGTESWGWHTVRWTSDPWNMFFPVAKTQEGLNAARLQYIMYWTSDDLKHGNVYVDAIKLRVKFAAVDPMDPPVFVLQPGEELDLTAMTWNVKLDQVGIYQATATVEYTSAGIRWNSWGSAQKAFQIKLVP